DRLPVYYTLLSHRYNGVTQQQYVVSNPDFFPSLPSPTLLAGLSSQQVLQTISSDTRAPYVLQTALTGERELTKNTTLSVTYANTHGDRLLHTEDVNAPVAGTYAPIAPNSAQYPLGHRGAVLQMESTGRYNQNQLLTNVNSRINANISLVA